MTTTPDRPAPLRDRVAEEIRVALARHRVSGAELARKLGVSQAYVWRRMSGDLPFTLDDVERIAEALDMEPNDLIPGGVRSSSWLRSAAGSTRPVARPPKRTDITRPGDAYFQAAA